MARLGLNRGLLAALVSLGPPAAIAEWLPEHHEAEIGVATAVRLHGDDRVTQKAVYLKFSLEDAWDSGYYKAKGRARYDFRYDGKTHTARKPGTITGRLPIGGTFTGGSTSVTAS